MANLLKRFKPPQTPPRPRSGPPGKRCYAIGDIHGRLDLLKQLLVEIARQEAIRPRRETIVVTLGDVIDRGPASRQVVELLMRPLPFNARLVCLKGNHEEMLVRGLSGEPEVLANWLQFGGVECAASYGVDAGMLNGQTSEVMEHNLAGAIPRSHVRFLASFADSARFGDYLFVHAGIRPGVPLEQQTPQDLRWIREGFLDSAADHDLMVVHGHSISLEVEETPNRVGIDTGAYKTGVLTAMWIEGSERGYLQASA